MDHIVSELRPTARVDSLPFHRERRRAVSDSEPVVQPARSALSVTIDGLDSGLVLDSAASLTIEDGGVIEFLFNEAGHGIQWPGDHTATLSGYLSSGKITATLDPAVLSQGYFTQIRTTDGATLLTVIPEPASLLLSALGLLALTFRRR